MPKIKNLVEDNEKKDLEHNLKLKELDELVAKQDIEHSLKVQELVKYKQRMGESIEQSKYFKNLQFKNLKNKILFF